METIARDRNFKICFWNVQYVLTVIIENVHELEYFICP
jgi:hypothetical protein